MAKKAGYEETGYERFNISLPPSIIARLVGKAATEDEEEVVGQDKITDDMIQKALDEYLKKHGY